MKRKSTLWATLAVVAVLASASLPMEAAEPKAPGPKAVAGKVVSVTLYRGQALVTRAVPVEAPAGAIELLVGDLPQQVVAESLFAEGSEGLDVRAVRFRTRAVRQEPREEVRKLDEQIEAVEAKISRNKKMQELVAQRLKYLDKLEAFTAPTAKVELTKGVLNVETLTKLTQFSFQEREKAAEEGLKLDAEARDLAKQLSLLQRQRSKLTAGGSRTVGEALVFLDKKAAGNGEIRLSYLVEGCGWSPAYNLRTNEDRTKVDVEYNAIVRQMSGEDWDGVQLTLSTASPALSAEGPGLAPFRLALSKGVPQGKQRQTLDIKLFMGRQQALASAAHREQRKAQQLRVSRDANWKMNVAANELQNIELVVERDAFRAMLAEAPADPEGPSVSYKLNGPVSLASRADQQMLRILETKLDTSFYYVATPILTSYVYREAKVQNTGTEVLLAGPVSVYLDGRFVGRGEVPTVAQGQSFVMGFGADPQLRARRERADRDERVQGGNREISVTYRIVLENYGQAPATVRVFDRVPLSERDTDIRVTLDEMKDDKLSTDKLYLRIEKPKGILRWEVEVPAKAAGETARILTYGYKIEFDRNLTLTTPGRTRASAMQQEFETMQKRRYNK